MLVPAPPPTPPQWSPATGSPSKPGGNRVPRAFLNIAGCVSCLRPANAVQQAPGAGQIAQSEVSQELGGAVCDPARVVRERRERLPLLPRTWLLCA